MGRKHRVSGQVFSLLPGVGVTAKFIVVVIIIINPAAVDTSGRLAGQIKQGRGVGDEVEGGSPE